MHSYTNRTRRLGLETLEGRALPSATLPTLAPAFGPAVVQPLSTTAIQTHAAYSYSWGVSPSAVITGTNPTTGNGRSTGSVDIALFRGGSTSATIGGAANTLPVAVVTSTCSASAAHPDHFSAPVTISMRITDAASHVTRVITFKAFISGTMTATRSAATLTFQSFTQRVTLGRHLYTITLHPSSLHVPAPGGTPIRISATVQVRNV
jgi:hypothetical protein